VSDFHDIIIEPLHDFADYIEPERDPGFERPDIPEPPDEPDEQRGERPRDRHTGRPRWSAHERGDIDGYG
jgi:hypothetical protein